MDTMQTLNRYLTGILCFLIFCLVMGCAAIETQTSESRAGVAEEGVLRVGVSANLPPIIFKQNRQIVGLEADLASSLAAELGKSLRFVELKWEDLIPALLEKRIDIIMSGMSVTESRKVRIEFSAPYLKLGQMALVRFEDTHKYPGLFSIRLCKGKVGTIEGTTGDYIVQRSFTKARRTPFNSAEKAVKALIQEEIDMFIYDAPVILWLASENESEGVAPVLTFLTEEYLAWALRYEDTDLLQKTNEFLASRAENGELRSVIKKWMPYLFQ
jgi:ABC-type amino acid transport substrate-binding protein